MTASFWKLKPVVTTLVTATWYETVPAEPRATSPRFQTIWLPNGWPPLDASTKLTASGNVSTICTPVAVEPFSLPRQTYCCARRADFAMMPAHG
jgi:hypothetical protein